VRGVEGDETLRDHVLAHPEVPLRDLQLSAVLAQIPLDLRELGRGGLVLRPGLLELIRQLGELAHHLLRFGTLRGDRGVGKRRDCRQKGDADPHEYVRRLSQPTYDNPLAGAGTGAPGGAGTSRRQEASKSSGCLPRGPPSFEGEN